MSSLELHPDTARQLAALQLTPERPLVICDADEVVVHFLKAFEDFIATQDLWLDPASLALYNNVKYKSDNSPVAGDDLSLLIREFFQQMTTKLMLIEGAADALNQLSLSADVVILTNIPFEFSDDRRQNLADHGINFPVISNTGGKGPAVASMAANHTGPVMFIDDSPKYLLSVHEHRPFTHLVHFAQDPRFMKHAPEMDFLSLRCDNWLTAQAHLANLIATAEP